MCYFIVQEMTLMIFIMFVESTRYVGEELSLGCTRNGGGGPGRWYINEVYTNVTAARFVDTIEVVDGEFNYDGTLRCEGGDSYSMKTYGE